MSIFVKCFHLSPGNNQCSSGEECSGYISRETIHVSQWYPDWSKKNKKEIVTDSPFSFCVNKEDKHDMFFTRDGIRKDNMLNECVG